MTQNLLLIKTIKQKDNHTLSIDWSDGISLDYRLSDLQCNCPCAGCYDVNTKTRRKDAKQVDVNVRAIRISNVGRYALRIEFTNGCTMGIYHYKLLRNLNAPIKKTSHE